MADPTIKCLFFDVFGTCVDWRKSITDYLAEGAQIALSSAFLGISPAVRERAEKMTYEDWGKIAQEWRNSYLTFTRSIANNPLAEYKTVDQHHYDSLHEILGRHQLMEENGSLWKEDNMRLLSLRWHHLNPWKDARAGIIELNKAYKTCTLSNGNLELLNDLVTFAELPFTDIYSAAMFQSYKPNEKVYLGAAEKMGLKPEECMMVAAHLDDLKYAKKNGFQTLYVERPQEERHPEMREDGFVDYWVTEDEDGFVAAAKKLAAGERLGKRYIVV